MNREIERLLNDQADLYGRISRAFENLKKTGAAKITEGITEARLQSLETNWVKFETNHEKVKDVPPVLAQHNYVTQDLPELTEEAYLDQKGAFLDLLRDFKAKRNPAVPVADLDSTASTASTPLPHPCTTLPRIQLPHRELRGFFSGKYEDWPSFRDLFQSLLGRDSSTTQVEKLHYLKTCVKGEAESLIRNFTTTDENYERAWTVCVTIMRINGCWCTHISRTLYH